MLLAPLRRLHTGEQLLGLVGGWQASLRSQRLHVMQEQPRPARLRRRARLVSRERFGQARYAEYLGGVGCDKSLETCEHRLQLAARRAHVAEESLARQPPFTAHVLADAHGAGTQRPCELGRVNTGRIQVEGELRQQIKRLSRVRRDVERLHAAVHLRRLGHAAALRHLLACGQPPAERPDEHTL